MAYMVEIRQGCDADGCTKRATHQVFAYTNEPFGRYCRLHAERRVAALTEAEQGNPEGFRR